MHWFVTAINPELLVNVSCVERPTNNTLSLIRSVTPGHPDVDSVTASSPTTIGVWIVWRQSRVSGTVSSSGGGGDSRKKAQRRMEIEASSSKRNGDDEEEQVKQVAAAGDVMTTVAIHSGDEFSRQVVRESRQQFRLELKPNKLYDVSVSSIVADHCASKWWLHFYSD